MSSTRNKRIEKEIIHLEIASNELTFVELIDLETAGKIISFIGALKLRNSTFPKKS